MTPPFRVAYRSVMPLEPIFIAIAIAFSTVCLLAGEVLVQSHRAKGARPCNRISPPSKINTLTRTNSTAPLPHNGPPSRSRRPSGATVSDR